MKLLFVFALILGLIIISCKESPSKHDEASQSNISKTTNDSLKDSLIVYQTEHLIIKRLSNHIYVHMSYLHTDDFGKVECNGMIVINETKSVVFDTPTDNNSSIELINFVTKELKCDIIALIPTHFHNDCVGGLAEFEERHMPTYASKQTIELLKENGQKVSQPMKGFTDSLALEIGNKKVYATYFGEGHTKDNIIGYFPDDSAVFGGCLIKEVGANKGFLGDANINEWSKTVIKIKQAYPNAQIVIPGHGNWGKTELFDYTINLFE